MISSPPSPFLVLPASRLISVVLSAVIA